MRWTTRSSYARSTCAQGKGSDSLTSDGSGVSGGLDGSALTLNSRRLVLACRRPTSNQSG